MKSVQALLFVMAVPFLAFAQKADHIKAKPKKNDSGQAYQFPDHMTLDKQELNKRVQEKTAELSRHIKNLAQSQVNAKAEVDETMKLFNNDLRKTVTVTSKAKPQAVTKPVKLYLLDLARLHYDKVHITWTNAQYVTNFVKQPDGTYTALVAFEQQFTGVKGGEASYTYNDVTQKRVEVTVKVHDIVKNGVVTKSYADVFLGNIGVTEE